MQPGGPIRRPGVRPRCAAGVQLHAVEGAAEAGTACGGSRTGMDGNVSAAPKIASDPRQSTILRLDHGLARTLDQGAQLKQCVDHLENPEVLGHELRQSWLTVERVCRAVRAAPAPGPVAAVGREDTDVLELEHFYGGREVEVATPELHFFECLASNLQPLARAVEEPDFDGLDYVGLVQVNTARGVLGVIESKSDHSPYLLLLRALCGFVELAAALRCGGLADENLARALAGEPRFDLHLVLSEPVDRDAPLHQLTRDLAESVKRAAVDMKTPSLPLGDILCLRMDLAGFSGRLEHEWIV